MDLGSTHYSYVIPLSVTPVVIISACGLLCLAFYNRLSFLVSRLRFLQKESFDLTEKKVEKGAKDYLKVVQQQVRLVFRRARLIRFTLIALLSAIFSEVCTCLLIGFSLFLPDLEGSVLVTFLSGLGCILIALIAALKEVILTLEPVKLEALFIKKLIQEKKGLDKEILEDSIM